MAKLRAAIYVRHLIASGAPASSDHQIVACHALADKIGAKIITIYTDPITSGSHHDRPGLNQLLSDIEQGAIDVLLCEALDRIARDSEDIIRLSTTLSHQRIRLFTQTEKEIDVIELAATGLLNSILLNDQRARTFRRMKAAIMAGRLAGVSPYAYRKVARQNAHGRLVNGTVEIDPSKAPIVERICREFAGGRSCIDIAAGLNKDGIPAPRGAAWNASTIRGDPKKLVGILNNPLYRGVLIWGRRESCRNLDPDRQDCRYRLREQSEWARVDMPGLRILDDDLSQQVDAELRRRSMLSAR